MVCEWESLSVHPGMTFKGSMLSESPVLDLISDCMMRLSYTHPCIREGMLVMILCTLIGQQTVEGLQRGCLFALTPTVS